MKEKVVVLGAAGFIGSHLTVQLASLGYQVFAVDSFDETLYAAETRRQVAKGFGSLGVEFLEGDATLLDWPQILKGVDVVYNLAAVPGLLPSWSNFDKYVASNVRLVNALLLALVDNPTVHLVQASTSSVYGKVATGGAGLLPNSPYGVTKLAAENLIGAYYANFGVSSSILRYFSVYGPRPRPDQFFSILIGKLASNRVISINGDGLNSRTFTFVDDIVSATIAAGRVKKANFVADISGGESITTLEVVERISELMRVKPRLEFVPDRPGDQRATKGNNDLALEVLGWSPKVSLEHGFRALVDWHGSNLR
ncbi:MAG: hypothetical protein RI929_299 [Actinomycetota bacterium]|jgi:nucleoside-diphosphate-sugar epimerase